MRAAGFVAGGALLASCAPKAAKAIESVTSPVPSATDMPTPADTQTAVVAASPTAENLPLHFGEFDMKVTPFTLKPTPETESYLEYTPGGFPETFADIPLPFGIQNVGSEEEYALEGEHNDTFEKAAKKHPKNPYYVVLSDLPNLVYFNFHSVQETAVGDAARRVGSFALRHPEKNVADELLGKKFIINFNQETSVEAEIAYVTTVSREYFDDLTATGPWAIDEDTGALYGQTIKFGMPNTIRHDRTPGVYFMGVFGCQSADGYISLWLSKNVVNRSLMVLKFTLPQK